MHTVNAQRNIEDITPEDQYLGINENVAWEDEVTGIRPIPFKAVGTDYDGIVDLYGKATEAEAQEIRRLLIEKTLAQGVPLAFITGKDIKDIEGQIIGPFRQLIEQAGIELDARDFMVYANNGSVQVDVGLDNQILEAKEFKHEQLEKIAELEVVQILMAIYQIFDDIRSKIPEALSKSRFREERTTLGFSMDPKDLRHPTVKHLYNELVRLSGGKQDLTRFDIGEIFKKQLAAIGLDQIKVAVTDGAVDLTPENTGKRNALEDFADKHGVKVSDVLRFGDNPAGSDFELLAAKEGENRGGFTNVPLHEGSVKTVMAQPAFKSFHMPPKELPQKGNQFQTVIEFLKQVTIIKPAS